MINKDKEARAKLNLKQTNVIKQTMYGYYYTIEKANKNYCCT